jgi:hypothetical protein
MAWVAANTVARTMNGFRQVSPPRNAGFRQVRPSRNAGFARVRQAPAASGFVRVRPPVRTGGFVQMRVPVHALGHGLPIHPRSIPNYTVASPQAVPEMGGIDAFISNLLNQHYGVQAQPVPDMSGVDAYLAQLLASRHPYAGAQPV